jgi:hypothetical protein
MSALSMEDIKKFNQSVTAKTGEAGRQVNGLGQQEVGGACCASNCCPPANCSSIPRWQAGIPRRMIKAEAMRQMYMGSTEKAPQLRFVGACWLKMLLYSKVCRTVLVTMAEPRMTNTGVLLAKHQKTCNGCAQCMPPEAAASQGAPIARYGASRV